MDKLAATLLVASVAGCSSSGGLFGRTEPPPAPVTPTASAAAPLRGDALTLYLDTLHDLLDGDAVEQADTFRNAANAADVAPTTTNRLNLALALATPGHPSSNPVEAQRLLSSLIATGDALLPEERVLALVHLKEVEQRLILDAEAERLERAARAASAQRNDESAQRLQAALDENRKLRMALDEALQKLDAITNIEQSIRERGNGADSQ